MVLEQGDEQEPLIMNQQEFATLSGFSISTIYRWVRDGTLPVLTINGRYYIRRDLVMAWLDQHTSGGRPPERS
ncbi:MAG TPA: helix-turn-helix domain-containing protein [Terriglobia bacterium]|nr:helix-turn-helix domain-containing protein [Terriglobia bacterium]